MEDKYDESRARNEKLLNKVRLLEEEKEENLIKIEGKKLIKELEEEINSNKQKHRFSRTINPNESKEIKKMNNRSQILQKLKNNEWIYFYN